MHVEPLQQPLAHEVGLHAQAPFTHCCPDAQGLPAGPQLQAPLTHRSAIIVLQPMQVPPSGPQSLTLIAVTQLAPLQQPSGHVVALQTQPFPTHWLPAAHPGPPPQSQPPSTQSSVDPEQVPQAFPLVPQALADC
jgi:hypothetical protein